jgi:DNA-binding IclR family transcriptional regulator
MARPAPSVDRVVAVLNFFAQHHEHGFTLTDLVRSLHLNRATCHALLKSLTDSGYLYRNAAKEYRMGPALAAIGRVADQSFVPVAIARDDMRRLADKYDLLCVAASRVGNEMIFLERTVSRSNLAVANEPQRRHRILPPGGSSFIAWAAEAEVSAWIKAFEPALSEQEEVEVRTMLAKMRSLQYSYSIEVSPQAADPLTQMAVGWRGNGNPVAHIVPDLLPDHLYGVVYISAPVLGVFGEVLFTLTLSAFDGPVSGRRIQEIGEDLRTTTDRIAGALSPGLAR